MRNRILVVEDFATIRNFICDMLLTHGYDTVGVATIQDAWATVSFSPSTIDLIVTDYYMPEGNGLELLKKIKSDPSTSSIPVIFLTAETDPEKINEAKNQGLYAWIVKPYRSATFFATIRAALDAGREQSAL
jgi:two-component system, chemotaxis family, chemotaxis protein CheY